MAGRTLEGDAENETEDRPSLVGEWIDRTDRLAEFLSIREDLWIPEMEFVSARDWLEATNVSKLENEAEYRHALATLRHKAKLKVARKLSKALDKYVESVRDESASDISGVAAFLDGSLDPAILRRFRLAEPWEIDSFDRSNGMVVKLVEHRFPDEVWHSILTIGLDGSYGIEGPGPVGESLEAVYAAIANFEAEQGRDPEGEVELLPYFETVHKPGYSDLYYREHILAKYRAMNSPVLLPSEGETL